MSKRTRMILTGTIPIFSIALFILFIGQAKKLPGFTGEVFSMIAGFMFSPFFMEITFFFLGLVALFWINGLRLQKEGDEYVSLEIPEDPDDSNT